MMQNRPVNIDVFACSPDAALLITSIDVTATSRGPNMRTVDGARADVGGAPLTPWAAPSGTAGSRPEGPKRRGRRQARLREQTNLRCHGRRRGSGPIRNRFGTGRGGLDARPAGLWVHGSGIGRTNAPGLSVGLAYIGGHVDTHTCLVHIDKGGKCPACARARSAHVSGVPVCLACPTCPALRVS
jgi:hypothetical protein